jgi:DNA polymerase-3 subunit epsilon
MPPPFVAIDFETADTGPDSACAVALVRVEGWEVVAREARLIRPPRRYIRFSYIHGIEWPDVADEPPFCDVWPRMAPLLEGASHLVAHNAAFDRGVLRGCCAAAGLEMPAVPFLCSLQVARRTWNLRPANLPAVCRFLHIPLNHHDALSDAEAAARIVIAARRSFDRIEHASR